MEDTAHRAIAIVGVGAILPDAPDAPAFWENVKAGRYSISEVTPGSLGPGALLRPRPRGARQDLLEDRRLRARGYEWDPVSWKLPDPPARGRRHGRGAEVGRRRHARGPAELRLARAPARPRAHRRDPRQRDGRREALPDRVAHLLPRVRPRARSDAELRRPAARGSRDGGRASCGLRSAAASRRSPKTRCPGARQLHGRPHRQPLQLPRPELRVRRGLRLRPGRDERRRGGPGAAGLRRGRSRAASTATWAPRPT